MRCRVGIVGRVLDVVQHVGSARWDGGKLGGIII